VSAVVGIFANTDTVGALAHAMKSAGFDVADLTVISNQEPTGYIVSVGANFVSAMDPSKPDSLLRLRRELQIRVSVLRRGAAAFDQDVTQRQTAR